MGLSYQSTIVASLKRGQLKRLQTPWVVALAGNPNTGKSTLFNSLTGLHQHTGNWPGKTVLRAEGHYKYQGEHYSLVDLPGTYSLFASSVEEQVARDFIYSGSYHAVVIVVDATCLERNLNLVLQVLEITPKVIVCVNLLDEAARKGIEIDLKLFNKELGVPVVGTNARAGTGLEKLRENIRGVAQGKINCKPRQIIYDREVEAAIEALLPKIAGDDFMSINPRWLALRLLEGEEVVCHEIKGEMANDTKTSKLALLGG
ncbi:MAG: FeoB small GTPase domain-containing protein [Bacillota bacterium]